MRSLDKRGHRRLAGLRAAVAAWCAAVLVVTLAPPARAEALAGVPEVRSAFVSRCATA
jgi:hypothetical protein